MEFYSISLKKTASRFFQTKGLEINNSSFLHPSFRPSLADPQSQNPQRGTTTLAVLLNRIDQICPKSVRQFQLAIDFQTLKKYPGHILFFAAGAHFQLRLTITHLA
jgi:hypothetical protein